MLEQPDVQVLPATAERWADLEALFGLRGACGGCWCMWWRQTAQEYNALKGTANRDALRRIVEGGQPPGLLAYANGKAIGWCALAPRTVYTRLERTRILKPVDDTPVWSIVCFFVAKVWRRRGVTRALLQAAIDHARTQGAVALEAYPVDPPQGRTPDVYAYSGIASTFRALGFHEAARRSPTRPIMRLAL